MEKIQVVYGENSNREFSQFAYRACVLATINITLAYTVSSSSALGA